MKKKRKKRETGAHGKRSSVPPGNTHTHTHTHTTVCAGVEALGSQVTGEATTTTTTRLALAATLLVADRWPNPPGAVETGRCPMDFFFSLAVEMPADETRRVGGRVRTGSVGLATIEWSRFYFKKKESRERESLAATASQRNRWPRRHRCHGREGGGTGH